VGFLRIIHKYKNNHMKKFNTIFSLLLLSLPIFIGSCKKDPLTKMPIADFSFSGGNSTAPVNVSFTNLSQNATSYQWDFGNGQSSTETAPTATYAVGGVYTITLTAKSDAGTNKITKTINILNEAKKMPVADFNFSGVNLRAPIQVSFTNLSENATSYSWDFGNGTSSTASSPKATYNDGGNFTITLTATNANGTNKITKNISILKPYTKVGIEVLTINKYPATKVDGTDWDGSFSGTYPDVYFEIVNSTDQSSIYSLATTSRIENLRTVDLPKGWSSTVSGTAFCDLLKNVDFDVDLYDFESLGTDEYIGTAEFQWSKISTTSTPYPSTVESSVYNGSTSKVGITLKLIWKE
jgi:PKD repeat protein